MRHQLALIIFLFPSACSSASAQQPATEASAILSFAVTIHVGQKSNRSIQNGLLQLRLQTMGSPKPPTYPNSFWQL